MSTRFGVKGHTATTTSNTPASYKRSYCLTNLMVFTIVVFGASTERK